MDCQQALEAISAALDGELSPRERRELNAHLEKCPTCRALYQDFSAIHDACSGLEVTPPPELKDQITAHLPPQDPVSIPNAPAKTSTRRWQRWGAMAAAFALVCLAAWQLPKFLFTQQPDVSTGSAAPEAADTSAPLELPDESVAPFSESGSENVEEPTQAAGGVQNSAVTGAGTAPETASEDVAENAAARSAQPAEASAETPPQGALADAVLGDAGSTYGAETTSDAATDMEYKGRKITASTSASPAPSAAPAVKQAVSEAEEPPTPAPAPEASATYRFLFTAQSDFPDGVEADEGAAVEDALPAATGETSTIQFTAASLAPQSDPPEVSVSLYADDGLSSENALTTEVPQDTGPLQPFVDTADFEKVIPTAGASPAYCGEITLLEGRLLGDYPQEEQEDGTVWYTLPAHQFWVLLQQLRESSLSYQFQLTGDHIDPAATQGLVILPKQ